MNPLWRRIVYFVVALVCATGALVAAGLQEERTGNDTSATRR
jgi:hypothetical protein